MPLAARTAWAQTVGRGARDRKGGLGPGPTWGVCAGQLTQTFIEQASATHLNTGCLTAAGPPAFDLTLP